MCVMGPQLIRMLDEVLNCSQCVFHSSLTPRPCWDSFRLHFASFDTPASFSCLCFLLFYFFFYFLARLFKEYSCIVEIDSSDSISQKQPRYCASPELERVEKVQI